MRSKAEVRATINPVEAERSPRTRRHCYPTRHEGDCPRRPGSTLGKCNGRMQCDEPNSDQMHNLAGSTPMAGDERTASEMRR